MQQNNMRNQSAKVETEAGRPAGPLRVMIAEVSGAFGDLGTFLPYVVAAVGTGLLAPAPVLLGFGAGYLLVATVYRVPIAVQPMKALGAMILAGGLGAAEIAWTGAILGALLLLFAATPVLGTAARAIPQSVVTGLQAGLGLMLGAVALRMMGQDWSVAAPTLAVLACSFIWRRGPWALVVVLAGVLLAPSAVTTFEPLPAMAGLAPDMNAVLSGVLAQMPLTLLNAIVVTTALAHSLFPTARHTVSERKLAATSGVLNLVFVPFGALPMCHGAGGVASHHRFGARGIGAPLMLAAICAVGVVIGPGLILWLATIPTPVVGALLAYASADLVLSKRMFDARKDCRPVIAAAAIATFGGGALAGLLAGLATESLRRQIVRRMRGDRSGRIG